jgi:protein-tyrosine-phosphatase
VLRAGVRLLLSLPPSISVPRAAIAARPRIAFGDSMSAPLKRVLFVCVENANRSQMAQAFARLHGGDGVEALSAGSLPSGVVNPKAVRFMAELGYDLTTHASKSLDEIGGEFDAVVTMGCGDNCPWVPTKRREDWALPDPRHMDDDAYRAVRDEISARVRALLASL